MHAVLLSIPLCVEVENLCDLMSTKQLLPQIRITGSYVEPEDYICDITYNFDMPPFISGHS